MTPRTYTIGQVARLSGVPVKRLRFYADEGLIPPAGRTDTGYRVFTDEDVIRIELIRNLREAGIGLDAIRDLLTSRASLKDVLALRLDEIETQIVAHRRVASALRAALSADAPTEDDLRRIWIMTQLSHAERRASIERFFDTVADDLQIKPGWKEWILDLSTPELPDEPTPEQIDAWIELQKLLADPAFAGTMRDNAKDSVPLNGKEMTKMHEALMIKARTAVDQGADPASATGRELASEYFGGLARAAGTEPNDHFRAQMRRKHLEHQPKMRRYWGLITILGGLRGARERKKTWRQPEESRWLGKAIDLWFAEDQA
jgi:DNA-binding transcriptional MerR regulator